MIPRLDMRFPIRRQLTYWFGKEYEPQKGEYLLNHARSGIVMALRAALPHGGRVGVVTYNCHTVANAVVSAGCIPVSLDVTDDLKIDLCNLVSDTFLHKNGVLDAIIVTNLFGIRNDIDAIRKACPNAFIIVDNAHGYGLPAEGDCTVYSINQGKYPALGEGGILVVGSEEGRGKNEEVRLKIEEQYRELPGYSAFQFWKLFAVMKAKAFLYQPWLYGWFTMRLKAGRTNSADHTSVVARKMCKGVSRMYGAWLQEMRNEKRELRNEKRELRDERLFMDIVRTDNPAEVIAEYRAQGIEADTHFKNCIRWATEFGYVPGSCPNAERLVNHLVMVPNYYKKEYGKRTKDMNVLLVSGHPAQVHNFRLVREELIKDGHQVYWLTTNKDIATNLLDIYQIPYELYHKPKKTLPSQLWALVRNTWHAMRFILRNHIDIAISRTDPYSTLACFLLRRKHIVIDDTEHAAVSIRQKPFALMGSCILVPDCFWYEISKKQMYFPGNIELFYCHPKRFHLQEPWSLLGFEPGTRYAIVRFVKWDAYHDTKLIGGYTPEDKIHLVHSLLAAGLRVLITSEAELPAELEQYRTRVPIERMHDVMACAELFIGESSSMASECVVLGIPAIYVDEVGRGYTDEEAREGLLYMYRPYADKATWREAVGDDKDFILGGRKESIEKAIEIASPAFDRTAWRQRHQAWLSTKFDCTAFLTWFIEHYPESESLWREKRAEIEKRFK